MPELPEVETVMRGLMPVLQGKRIKKMILNRPNLRYPFPENLSQMMAGRVVKSLYRRGKYIVMDIDDGYSLICHLGMSGSFAINPSSRRTHDHIDIYTECGEHIVYHDPRRFGFLISIKTDEIDTYKSFQSMGPEPLGNMFHGEGLFSKLQSKATPIKTALLDQSVVAGLGNIYVCEALYEAGISPLRLSNAVTIDEAHRLVEVIRQVLLSAIESGGSTLRDHRQADGELGYFQHHFKVYGREGEECVETGGDIERIVQSGRSTFYCPTKQV